MAPVRLALIGLSQSAKTSWASEGHLPYLLSERGRQRYIIKALLNSSEDAAKRAIQYYKLGPGVKAYGSPSALAADQDIDLVVCCTRVDTHYNAIRPSIEAGKNVFVEWPVAENTQRASELAALAKEKGIRTVVGLQARLAPAVLKVKELLQNGTIGKVLSSDVKAFSPYSARDSISEGLAYFLDRKVGGNPANISFGHMIDFIHSVLGEFNTFHAHAQIQRPDQTVINTETGAERVVKSDVPDLTSVHGRLLASPYVVEGASLILNERIGVPFPGTLPFVWTINGEKGEIRVTSEWGPFLQSEASAFEIPIDVHDFSANEVTRVGWKWEEWQESFLARGRNIGKTYDLYFEGQDALNRAGAADFEGAVKRHAELDAFIASTH